jgi:hypothetical protein
MNCPRCELTGGRAHSFEKIGTLNDSKTNLFYTCPSLAEEQDDSPEAVQYYLAHFESTRPNPWIWVFDCKGMKSKDLIKSGIGKKFVEAVQKNYYETLMGVYILNPNIAVKTLLTFVSPFLRKETKAKIHLCSLGPIDTINTFERLGVQRPALNVLTKRLTGL